MFYITQARISLRVKYLRKLDASFRALQSPLCTGHWSSWLRMDWPGHPIPGTGILRIRSQGLTITTSYAVYVEMNLK